jgi:hypothetical protein
MQVETVLSPRVDQLGLPCCSPFTIDFVNAATGEPMRNPKCRFYIHCAHIHCYHKYYCIRASLIKPNEWEWMTFSELPVEIILHRTMYCEECESTVRFIVDADIECKWSTLEFRLKTRK